MSSLSLKYTGKNQDPKHPYLPSDELVEAVNLSILLERPLLLKGVPGCGKTAVAAAVASELGLPLERWPVKSTSRARDGLYVFDGLRRLHDAQLAAVQGASVQTDSGQQAKPNRAKLDAANYIRLGPLGRAFASETKTVVLIDEIDKADIDFPNDLLNELDERYYVEEETGMRVDAKQRPIVIVTSNDEKALPDAFLRRCVFHYIDFPDVARLRQILAAHFIDLSDEVAMLVIARFQELRSTTRDKKPSTSELLDWVTVLQQHPDDEILKLLNGKLPYRSVLLKSFRDHLLSQEPLSAPPHPKLAD